MSITKDFGILFQLCNGYLVIRAGQLRQVALRTIMNTKVHMILNTLSTFFRIAKGILKYHKGVYMRVKGFSSSFTKKKKNNIK